MLEKTLEPALQGDATGPQSSEAPLAERIVDQLMKQGVLHSGDSNQVRELATQLGLSMSIALDRLGLVSQQAWIEAASMVTGYPVVEPDELPAEPPAEPRIAFDFMRRHLLLPIEVDAERVRFAIFDPSDTVAIATLKLLFGDALDLRLCIGRDIENALERLQQSLSKSGDTGNGLGIYDTERLIELANDAPTVRYVEGMLARAVAARATDLHLEPAETTACLRLRIDGVLQDGDAPQLNIYEGVASRLKIQSNLDIAERRLPQDGRMTAKLAGARVDIRIATAPTIFGEALTLRFLYSDNNHADLDRLDLPTRVRRHYQAALAYPNGLILVTGPTGSGKTTTLHAALAAVKSRGRKIITIEEPVEIRTAGLVQLEVNAGIGWTFASALRSVLRHDPDMIMVGEIRDQETADLAIRAALTGHLVLSTLHANRAVDAVTRLQNIGIDTHLLRATVRLIAAQRLVRKLCDQCARPAAPVELSGDGIQIARLLQSAQLSGASKAIRLRLPVGCTACHDGYVGRIAIHETMTMMQAEAAVGRVDQADELGLGYDGLRRILSGETTTEEVFRVVGPPRMW